MKTYLSELFLLAFASIFIATTIVLVLFEIKIEF